MVKYLIEMKQANFSTSEMDAGTLHMAIAHRHFHIVKYLIEEHNYRLSESQIRSVYTSAIFSKDQEIIDYISGYLHENTVSDT